MLRLRDIMTRDLVTFSPDLSIREAMSILAARHLSGAPVVASKKVLGVVSATDLLEFASSADAVRSDREDREEREELEEYDLPDEAEDGEPSTAFFPDVWASSEADVVERMGENEGSPHNALAGAAVSEVMTRTLCSLPADTSVEAAADYMRRLGIHRVLVTENDGLAGIVTTWDIAKAVADHRLTTARYVFGAAHPRWLLS